MGSEAILNTLKHPDRIEGNISASSTPIPTRDNVTFRLPRPKHTSPVKNTVEELTSRANLLNSYKWPAKEDFAYPGTVRAAQSEVPMVVGGSKASEQRQGYRRDAIAPSVEKLRSFPEVSNVVANLLADYEARAQKK